MLRTCFNMTQIAEADTPSVLTSRPAVQVPVAVQQHLPILREMGTRDAAGGKELLELLDNARRC